VRKAAALVRTAEIAYKTREHFMAGACLPVTKLS